MHCLYTKTFNYWPNIQLLTFYFLRLCQIKVLYQNIQLLTKTFNYWPFLLAKTVFLTLSTLKSVLPKCVDLAPHRHKMRSFWRKSRFLTFTKSWAIAVYVGFSENTENSIFQKAIKSHEWGSGWIENKGDDYTLKLLNHFPSYFKRKVIQNIQLLTQNPFIIGAKMVSNIQSLKGGVPPPSQTFNYWPNFSNIH